MDERTECAAFCEALGYEETPFGFHYADSPPEGALMASPCALPSREDEQNGCVDWMSIRQHFSCIVKYVWRARVQKAAAALSRERFGCLGGAFFLGYNAPQLEGIVHYVSSGIPGFMEGEHYIESPDQCRAFFQALDPEKARATHAVFKPLDQFAEGETPLLVHFFARPEVLCGLHQLMMFLTNDPQAVVSPFGASCTNLVAWPLKYLLGGETKAVLGGWDPSARQWFRPDELSFTVSHACYQNMLARWRESFLTAHAWKTVQKKIEKSRATWARD